MKSRLRSVAGANWRSSLIFLTDSSDSGRRIAYGARVVANGYRAPSAIRALFRATCDRTGKLPLFRAIFPDQPDPIVRNGPDGAWELAMSLRRD
jgi:hypothetical protein